MYAAIYGECPVGLTNKTKDEWGGDFPEVNQILATKLQEIAWKAVCSYSPLGYDCNGITTSTSNKKNEQFNYSWKIDNIYINSNTKGELTIYDILGHIVFSSKYDNSIVINTGALETGIYLLSASNEHGEVIAIEKIIKQ